MTEMSPAEAVFFAALEKSTPAERAAYLDTACDGEPDLRVRVEKLLAAHPLVGGFLEPAGSPTDATRTGAFPAAAASANLCGSVIAGRYKLLQQIGEGGMGTVYMAEQMHPVHRKVALKIIKAGMDSKQVIVRFEAERQALAMMDHVNIARVLDAGATDAGRPYFVMELVHGVAITKYCDDNHLTPRERLQLFVPVCQAIQHAHQKGIIHRDIKPSNVMVTLYDGKPVPKVIDFGVAKATEQKLTDRTLFTQYGTMIGTPQYMSPEQAEMSALGVDTRSDIYSLGVLLYELLTGNTPLSRERLKEAALVEVLRLIKEEDPPRPSTRLSDSGGALATISAQRHMEPSKLTKMMRGELDWIVMKSLEKDRNRRYETANGLAADVQRFLDDDIVEARPPSAGYRLKKLIRRNRGPVVATCLVFLALLCGIVGTTVGMFESKRQERLAKEAQRKEAERADAEVKQRRQARKAVDEMYFQVAEKWLAEQPQLSKLQREFLVKGLKYYEDFALANSGDPQERLETGYAYFRVGEIQYKLGQQPEAEKAYRQAISIFESLASENGRIADYRSDLLRSHNRLGGVLYVRGELQGAESEYRQGMEVGKMLVADFPKESDHWLGLGTSCQGLGLVLFKIGRFEEAENAYMQGLDIKRKHVEVLPSRPDTLRELANAHRDLGNLQMTIRRLQEAAHSHRQAVAHLEKLVKDFPGTSAYREDLTMSRNNLALVLREANQLPEAIEIQGQALEIQKGLATEYPDLAQYQQTLSASYLNFAIMLKAAGRLGEAEEAYGKAVEVSEKLVARITTAPEYQHLLAQCHYNLGNLLRETGRFPDAENAYGKAQPLLKGLVEKYPNVFFYRRDLGNSYVVLGLLLSRTGRHVQALKAHREALTVNPTDAKVKNILAWSLATCGDAAFRNPGEAVALAKEAVEAAKQDGTFRLTLGVAQYRMGDWKESIATINESSDLRRGGGGADGFFISMALWRMDDKEQARKRYDQALDWMEKNNPKDEELRRFRDEAAELMALPSDRNK